MSSRRPQRKGLGAGLRLLATTLGDLRQQESPHISPRHASTPSRPAMAAMTRAAAGSAHHHPATAFARSPTRSAAERYAQSKFSFPSLTVALELSFAPTLRFAIASSGIVTAVNAARPIPTQLADG
jgi:hypothetical protein